MLKNIFKVKKFFQIYSPVNGKCVDLKDVNDQMFADKIMGEGVAFKYNGNTIYSPCKGKIVVTSKGLNIEFTNKEEVTIKDVVMMINR